MLKQRHELFVLLMKGADALCVLGACLAAWAPGREAPLRTIARAPLEALSGSFALVMVPLTILTMMMTGLYRPRRDQTLVGEYGLIVRAALIALVVLISVVWMLGGSSPTTERVASLVLGDRAEVGADRARIVVLGAVLVLVLAIERTGVRLGLRAMRRLGWNIRYAAVIGVGRLGQITARTIERNAWTGIRVPYFISHHTTPRKPTCLGRPVLGGLDDIERVLEERPVDAVYLSVPNLLASEIPEILLRLERFAVDVRLIPDVRPRNLPQSMRVSELEGMPVLSYRESPMAGVGAVLKRSMDILGAALGLVVFSPVLAVAAAAIACTSEGPVLFKQRRVSLGGETFWIYKFRTMSWDAHADERHEGWTRRDDPRVTGVGRILRRTSLDELPQLVNVLLGHMSLVGPRPERVDLIDRFREDWRGYMLRQHVKAGMTGWAQVNGLRGDTSLRKRLQYDLFYIRHWSIWFDLWILALTPVRGFVHRNAH